MLIQPFIKQGHEVEICVSSYAIENEQIKNDFFNLVKPNRVLFGDIKNSDPFTSKFALFDLFDDNSDITIFTRIDAHWSKIICNENINFRKFNFLFPEKNWWNTEYKFTCDNFYIWPSYMTSKVKKAMSETYAFPRGKPLVDTHALMVKLRQYVTDNDIHMISTDEELSDVNSFYTCCRSGLPYRDCIHNDVLNLYLKNNWSFYK
jgi:hypothetical protein